MSKMEFSVVSEQFVKLLIKYKKLSHNLDADNIPSSLTKNIMRKIYKLLLKYDKYLDNNLDRCLTQRLVKINNISELPKCDLIESRYVPITVKNHIRDKAKYHLQYFFNCKGLKYTINFILFNDSDIYNLECYDKYIYVMLLWLLVARNQSGNKQCSENVNIYIYMTDMLKNFPENKVDILDVDHVNSAVTANCNKHLLIYRKEEWFKVFIHEIFHLFALDFSGYPNLTEFNDKIKTVFNIESDFNLFESYTEFWAETINLLIISFITSSNKQNFSEIWNIFTILLYYEQTFSMMQCIKALNYMNLQYTDLFTNKGTLLYKENTNVFSYHVIKTILLFNIDTFLVWCNTNNLNIMQFKITERNLNLFIDFIFRHYLSRNFLQQMQENKELLIDLKNKSMTKRSKEYKKTVNKMLNSFRMSLFELK